MRPAVRNMEPSKQSSTDFLDAVAAAFREGRWRADGWPAGVSPGDGAVDTRGVEEAAELLRRVSGGDLDVNAMPPRPPTLRGAAGATLVRLMRRAMFWLTGPVQQFHALSAEATKANAEWMQLNLRRTLDLQAALQVATERMLKLEERLERLTDVLSVEDSSLEGVRAAQTTLQEKVDGLEEALKDVRRVIAMARQDETEARILSKDVSGLRAGLQKASEEQRAALNELRGELAAVRQQVNAIEQGKAVEQLKTTEQAKANEQVQAIEEVRRAAAGIDRYSRETRRELAIQERRLSITLEEVRRRSGGEARGPAHMEEPDAIVDAWYTNFEDVFRGDRAEIKERLRVYLPVLKEAGCGTPEMPVLDVGCGRGEWLELLRDEGMAVRGIDINEEMVNRCQAMGLPAEKHDVLAYLRSVAAESVGVVTGFHIVEHLPFPVLLALLDEVVRVLRPGGVCIFETPNPSNLRVSSYTFYLDPSHRNPIPKELLGFLVEARGLCRVEAIELHPYPDSYRLPENGQPATRLLNDLLFGDQDYGVIGRKL